MNEDNMVFSYKNNEGRSWPMFSIKQTMTQWPHANQISWYKSLYLAYLLLVYNNESAAAQERVVLSEAQKVFSLSSAEVYTIENEVMKSFVKLTQN